KFEIRNHETTNHTNDTNKGKDIKSLLIRVIGVIRGFLLVTLTMGGTVRAAEADKLLPNESEYVVTLNVRSLLDSALTKKYGLPKMQELLKSDQEIQEIFKSLGLDPLADIHSLTLASTDTKD